MQPTRRYWEGLAVAGLLAVAAILFAEPLLLLGTAGITGWLLASQVAFVYAVGRLEDSIDISLTPARETTFTDSRVSIILSATGDTSGLQTTVTAQPSAGLSVDGDPETAVGAGTVFTVESSIAGTHRIDPPTIAVRDRFGLFSEEFTRGDSHELVVETRRPRNVHVGEGGRAISHAFGEHTLETTGSGFTPAELRQYVTEEPASHIDWKVTARLGEPYVREFEAESDLTTILVIDTRSSLAVGPDGETAADYLRAVALGHVTIAQHLGDQLGCIAVDDDGVRQLANPSNALRSYERTRRHIRGLETSQSSTQQQRSPPVHRRAAIYDTSTRFGRVLEAFSTARPTETPATNPLQAAVRTAVANQAGTVQVVLFTDDSDRAGIRDAVADVRHGDHRLQLILAPTVLYEPGALADISETTERYRAFERFRQQVMRADGVAAYEVTPREKIEAVLEEA